MDNSSATKQTIIKSIAALVCVAAICIASVSALGNYGDAVVGAAEAKTKNASVSEDAESDIGSQDETQVYIVDYGNSAEGAAMAAEASASDSAASSAAETPAAGDSKTNQTPAAAATDPLKFSTAQIVNYYNTCLKNTYSLPKLTIEKTEDIDIVIDDVKPGGSLIAKLGNKIISKYATATTYKDTFANGKSTTGGDDAQEFSMHANLVPAGAKSASIKKSGSGYEINIAVVPEKATLEKRPTYNSQCSNPLDLAAVDLFGIEVTQGDFNYPGTTLKAVVDANGRVISAVCTMPMNGTGAGGKLGINGSATVHGSMIKSAKFSF